jgi:hypothetical protein
VSYGHIEDDQEHGAGGAVARLRPETEQSRRDIMPITMSTVWIAGLGGILMLCFGMLLGSTWTVQILNRQCRRLAIERRELNATRLAMQDTSLHCCRCGKLIMSVEKQLSRGRGVG